MSTYFGNKVFAGEHFLENPKVIPTRHRYVWSGCLIRSCFCLYTNMSPCLEHRFTYSHLVHFQTFAKTDV